MNRNQNALLPLLAAVAGLAVGPLVATAQQPVDSRWLPWLGCWHTETLVETRQEVPQDQVGFGDSAGLAKS